MEFGEVILREVAADDPENRRVIFDPIPRVQGIEASADPLFDPRADLYLLSGRRRRAADQDAEKSESLVTTDHLIIYPSFI